MSQRSRALQHVMVGPTTIGGIRKNPATGLFEAPDGTAARNYNPAAGTQTPPAPSLAAPTGSGYLSLLADADITSRADQDKYSRYIDSAVTQGTFKAAEIVGVGEGPSSGIYVVDHRAVTQGPGRARDRMGFRQRQPE